MHAPLKNGRVWTAATGLVLAALTASVNPAAAADPATATFRALTSSRVVQFAVAVEGQRIGGGECTDLVDAALAHAFAKPGKDYVWGTKLRTLGVRGVAAGDII